MPVIPCQANLFHDEKELHQFLLAFQEKYRGNGSSPIVSFSQQIESIDPLAVIGTLAQPNQLHFYWENPRKKEAIAGCGTAKSLTVESPDRFVKSQQFIQDCLKKTIRAGDLHIPGSGPHLFCSFTFFSSQKNGDCPFPPATIFLPRFQVTRQKDHCVLVVNISIDQPVNLKLVLEKIRDQIQAINWSNCSLINCTFDRRKNFSKSFQSYASGHFKSAVNSALKSIEAKQFSKIVLARALDVISPVPFGLVASLNNLRQRHRDCYIFSTSNGKGHNFIGASPERLISIENQQLVTDALAGSAPRGKTTSEDVSFANRLLRNEKERREHQAVSEFITQRLCQLGLIPQRSPLKLLQLSNIQHLWTPIYAQLPADVHPLEIVAQLHPTPAVAGVPTQVACEQIRCYETFDRALYAAPLGWIDYQGNSQFVVGIRSALIEGDRARLYAGAGIVAGSDPDREFAEVQLKLQALLKALL